MALNPSPPGKAIADLFFNSRPAPGTPVTLPQLEALWEAAIGILYADLEANLGVLPGTFEVTVVGVQSGPDTVTAPVTGVGGPAE